MVTGWLVGLGQARGGSGACRSRVGGAFGERESWGARRRRIRWGPFAPFGRRARVSRMTGRLVRANGALGATGASRSRVRGSVGAGAEGPGGVGRGRGAENGVRGGQDLGFWCKHRYLCRYLRIAPDEDVAGIYAGICAPDEDGAGIAMQVSMYYYYYYYYCRHAWSQCRWTQKSLRQKSRRRQPSM